MIDTVLKHHLSRLDISETPSAIIQENKILLKLIRDFNNIVSQEVDKSLPKLNQKTDYLHSNTNPHKTLDSDIYNNNKLLLTMKEEYHKLSLRKGEITQSNYFFGLRTQNKSLIDQIKMLKHELHRFALEIQKDGKKLNFIENFNDGVPDSLIKCQKIEEEILVCEVKMMNLNEKYIESKKNAKEIEKKEIESLKVYEESNKTAIELGIGLENDHLTEKNKILTKKIANLQKKLMFFQKHNEKLNENNFKDKEDIKNLILNRDQRINKLTKGIMIEKEIQQIMCEKGEFDEDCFHKIEELKNIGGVDLLGDRVFRRFEGKNISFIEESKRRLQNNLTFISNRGEVAKILKINENNENIIKKDKKINETQGKEEISEDLLKEDYYLNENNRNNEKENENIKKTENFKELKTNESETKQINDINNYLTKESDSLNLSKNKLSNDNQKDNINAHNNLRNISLSNKNIDKNEKKTEVMENLLKNDNLSNKTENNSTEIVTKSFNFNRNKPENKQINDYNSNNLNNYEENFKNNNILNKSTNADKEISNDIINDNIKSETKTFNFSKAKEKNNTIQNNFDNTLLSDKVITQTIPAKPFQTKRIRNIFDENEEKSTDFKNIKEILEIKENLSEKVVNLEKKSSWLQSPKEKASNLITSQPQVNSLKKKIQDPFEVSAIKEEFDFGENKEANKKLTMNLKNKNSEKPKLDNSNNDFFNDFDF